MKYNYHITCNILAQGPLNRTCGDFWRMSWEKNCYRIIMLNKLMENGRVKCARYWPEQVNGKLNFEVGGVMYSVTLLVEDCKVYFKSLLTFT